MATRILNDLLFDANCLTRFRGDFLFQSMSAALAEGANALRFKNGGLACAAHRKENSPPGNRGLCKEQAYRLARVVMRIKCAAGYGNKPFEKNPAST